MTEKKYGGVDSLGRKGVIMKKEGKENLINIKKIGEREEQEEDKKGTENEIEGEQEYRKAGKIAAEIVELARKIVKKDVSVLEIAEKLEQEIEQKGAKPAFPIDVSCNEIAAHYSPSYDDKTLAQGIVKIDIGVSCEGYAVDTAVSIDVTIEQKYSELIRASNEALKEALKIAKFGTEVREIGKVIHEKITSRGFSPIRNLSGHELKRYKIHAGLTIPNYDNGNLAKLQEGVYAIEPFATTGVGIVQDGGASSVYELKEKKPIRDSVARQILNFIEEEYKSFPFSSRWVIKKFGTRSIIALNFLEKQGCIQNFSHLVEKSRMPVSQSEHTILVKKDKTEILTAVE